MKVPVLGMPQSYLGLILVMCPDCSSQRHIGPYRATHNTPSWSFPWALSGNPRPPPPPKTAGDFPRPFSALVATRLPFSRYGGCTKPLQGDICDNPAPCHGWCLPRAVFGSAFLGLAAASGYLPCWPLAPTWKLAGRSSDSGRSELSELRHLFAAVPAPRARRVGRVFFFFLISSCCFRGPRKSSGRFWTCPSRSLSFPSV